MLEEQRQKEIGGKQTAGEKSQDSDERRQLKIGKAGDSVAGCAASGVGGAKANQESAEDDGDKAAQGQQCMPVEDLWGATPEKS